MKNQLYDPQWITPVKPIIENHSSTHMNEHLDDP
jgi:hypothetical protein